MNKQSLISCLPYPTAIYGIGGKNLSFFLADSKTIIIFHQLHSFFGKRFEENQYSKNFSSIACGYAVITDCSYDRLQLRQIAARKAYSDNKWKNSIIKQNQLL
ncbi:hypothetical protein LDO51_19210 [Providencia alcalifaciens]|uniref:hypothetical protein n=1 Tax=Providencia alcalifaciens TaxID=126385 RepID=UPI001CE03AA4|nr:hypothetical protein LDO51_19210 [Providencia alcalifaciens]